ncbi:endonuclease NucS domain-containing protein [[Eubacterium] cellulosolvens]
MYKIELYYDRNASYSTGFQQISDILEKLKQTWQIEYELFEAQNISSEESQKIEVTIRSIPPQVRGRIVSSGNHILPLSRKKNLNLKNTPIIILKKKGIPTAVFPHLLGTNYGKPLDSLSRIYKVGPDEYLEVKGLLEDPIVKILSDNPKALGAGTSFVDTNVETDAGIIDILLKDKSENHIVVEVETKAKDVAVAQVCRLAAGYAKSNNLSLSKIRKVIVCISYEGQLNVTCEGSDVELYQIELIKIK